VAGFFSNALPEQMSFVSYLIGGCVAEMVFHDVLPLQKGQPAVKILRGHGQGETYFQAINQAFDAAREEFDIVICDTTCSTPALLREVRFDYTLVPLQGESRAVDACMTLRDVCRDVLVSWELLGVVHIGAGVEYDDRHQIPDRLQKSSGEFFLGSIPHHRGWGGLFPCLSARYGLVSEETIAAYCSFVHRISNALEAAHSLSPREHAVPFLDGIIEELLLPRRA